MARPCRLRRHETYARRAFDTRIDNAVVRVVERCGRRTRAAPGGSRSVDLSDRFADHLATRRRTESRRATRTQCSRGGARELRERTRALPANACTLRKLSASQRL